MLAQELAKIESCELEIEDHGILTLSVSFDYGGSGQGLGGYVVDTDFIRRFMEACDTTKLSDCAGKIVIVEHIQDKVLKIKPLPFEKGTEFVIADWQEKFKK